MKLSTIHICILIAVALTCSAQDKPKPVADGSKWKITFPAKSPKGNALEIRNPEFSKYLKSETGFPDGLSKYFYLTEEGLVFHTEYTGVTTSSSTKYSRTELREMAGADEYNWTLDRPGRLSCKLKVAKLEGGANKFFFMQIHGKKPKSKPLIKCIWEKGRIRLLARGGEKLRTLKKKDSYADAPVGQWFTCTIRISRDALAVLVNDKVVETFTADEALKFWPENNTYYFKAGNYLQHDTPGAKATVVFASIDVSHGKVE